MLRLYVSFKNEREITGVTAFVYCLCLVHFVLFVLLLICGFLRMFYVDVCSVFVWPSADVQYVKCIKS